MRSSNHCEKESYAATLAANRNIFHLGVRNGIDTPGILLASRKDHPFKVKNVGPPVPPSFSSSKGADVPLASLGYVQTPVDSFQQECKKA